MKDRDFEIQMERARLLTNEGYFGRFRELCPNVGVTRAWQQVESELPAGLRRFTHIKSFERAKSLEARGDLPEVIIFKFGV